MLEAAAEALGIVWNLERFGFLSLGCLLGLTIGLLPGLGGTVGMSILLPFVFGMDPASGIALLIGFIAVTHTGDTFPSVLIGVPGTSGSQATILDGYALSRQGNAGMALGAAFGSSMAGGVIGALVLMGSLAIVRPLVLALGSPELFMLAVFGLAMVGILSRGAPLAGLAAGFLGLVLGSVGGATATAAYRFTYDSLYLTGGIPLAVLALGIFGIPEVVDLLSQRGSIAEVGGGGKLSDGIKAAIKHRWLVLRSAVIGNAGGMLPGVGGSVLDWIIYGITRQTSRDNSKFGQGDIRGVIGPESANNAKDAGTLVPTIAFGIPGNGATAVLLGGLILMGMTPGPRMVDTELPFTLSIIWTLVIANILGAGLCLALAKPVSRLTLVPAAKLMPFVFLIMVAAAYQSTRSWGDIILLLVLGMLGWAMKHVGFPRPPLLIGFVLAEPAERYLWISVSRYGAEWLLRPGVLVIASLVAGFLLYGVVMDRKRTVDVEDHVPAEGDGK